MVISPQNRKLGFFLLKGFFILLVWYFFYDLWIYPDGRFDLFLNKMVAAHSVIVLHIFTSFKCNMLGPYIQVIHGKSLGIGNGCNGLDLFLIFSSFIIIYPGKIVNRILYIFSGILLIHLLNIIRVVLLVVSLQYSDALFHVNHKYIFVFVVYLFIFGMWIFWVNVFSKTNLRANFILPVKKH